MSAAPPRYACWGGPAFPALSLLALLGQKPERQGPAPDAGEVSAVAVPHFGLSIRTGPGGQHIPYRNLPNGTPVRILQTQEEWLYVETCYGLSGWTDGKGIRDPNLYYMDPPPPAWRSKTAGLLAATGVGTLEDAQPGPKMLSGTVKNLSGHILKGVIPVLYLFHRGSPLISKQDLPALAPLRPGEVREYRVDVELKRTEHVYHFGFALEGGSPLAVVWRPRIEPGEERPPARELWEKVERLRPTLHEASEMRQGELPSPDGRFLFRVEWVEGHGTRTSLRRTGADVAGAANSAITEELYYVSGFLWVPGRPHSLLFANNNGLMFWEGGETARPLPEPPSVKGGSREFLGVTRDGQEAVYLHFPFDELEAASLRFLRLPSPRPSGD